MPTDIAIRKIEVLSPSALKDLCEKIFNFCETISERVCYPYQKEFALRLIESVVVSDTDNITCLISRQAGKSETVSVVITGLLVILPELAKSIPALEKFKEGFWVGIFAPTAEQGLTTYSKIRTKLKSKKGEMITSDPEIDKKVYEQKGVVLGISNGSFCRVQSANKLSKVESKTYMLIVVEESQDVDDDKITRQINPMGAAVGATQLYIGTPGVRVGEFYRAIQRNKIVKRGMKRNHFEYNYKICQKYNPYYKRYIAKEKIRLGEDSDAFRMAYNIEWLLERGMFCTLTMLEELYVPEGKLEYYKKSGRQCAGIDFGKQSDSTVITVLDMNEESRTEEGEVDVKILAWLEIEGDNYEIQYPRYIEFLSNYNIKTLCGDGTGVGSPIMDRLESDLGSEMSVVAVTSTLQKDSEMNAYLQKLVLAQRLYIPAHASAKKLLCWRKFVQQMTDLEKDYKGKHMTVHHPAIKDAHDDYFSSLKLAAEASKTDTLPEIETFNRDYLFK